MLRTRREPDGRVRSYPLPELPRASDLTGLQALQLLNWYFERRLGQDIPDHVETFAQSLGYHDGKDFVDALFKEYTFLNSEAGLETS